MDEKYIHKIDEKPRDCTTLFLFLEKRKPVLKEKNKKVLFGKLINNLVGICVIRWLKKEG